MIKNVSIEFAEWITQSVWAYYDEKGQLWTDSSRIITTEELFKLFLDEYITANRYLPKT